MNKEDVLKSIEVLVVVSVLFLLFILPIVPVAVYGEGEKVYGMSSMFERVINPVCPEIVDVKIRNKETGNLEPYATAIIVCNRQIRWFNTW